MWLESRRDFVKRKLVQDVKVEARSVIIKKALIKAQANIDQIIKDIKPLKNKAEIIQYLMVALDISRSEAEYVAELKLHRLNNIEAVKLEAEIKESEETIKRIQEALNDKSALDWLISVYLNEAIERYSSPRKTALSNVKLTSDNRDLIEDKSFLCTISNDMIVFSKEVDNMRSYSSRNVKGTNLIPTRYNKSPKFSFLCSTHDNILCFTKKGIMFVIKAIDFMVNYKHISAVSDKLSEEELVSVIPVNKDTTILDKQLVIATRKSFMKRVSLEGFGSAINHHRSLIVHDLTEGDEVVNILMADSDDDNVVISTNQGRIQSFLVKDLKSLKRTTMGLKRIKLKDDEYLTDLALGKADSVMLVTNNGIGKYIDINSIPERSKAVGAGGAFVGMKISKDDSLEFVELFNVKDIDNLSVTLVTQNNKTATIPLNTLVYRKGRATGGVPLMKLDEGTTIGNISLT